MVTDVYTPFGVGLGYFIVRDDVKIKIVIDPEKFYFQNQIIEDRKNYDKLILIQGMEPKELSFISDDIIKTHKYFDKILTSYDEIIFQCPNSERFSCCSSWILTDMNENTICMARDYHNIHTYNQKKFQVSHVMSNKNYLPGHILRHDSKEMIKNVKNINLLFPDFIPNSQKYKLFKDSMFHISIENTMNRNYFSEKIIDCFMSYTIPIYWGCPNISDYFDPKGIIFFENIKELELILNNLTSEDYYNRIESIKRNYELAYENHAFFYDRVNKILEKI